MIRPILPIATTLVLLMVLAPGLQADPPQAAPEKTSIMVYDIRDITWSVRPYPISPSMVPTVDVRSSSDRGGRNGGGGQGLMGADAAGPEKVSKEGEISSLIKETVDRESWVDNGGKVGSIRMFEGKAIVNQTEKNHAAIEDLLKQLRASTNKMVRIQARWVLLAPGEVETLVRKPQGGKPGALQEVDPDALTRLEQKGAAFRGQTTCFNGQTVSLASGRARNVITDSEMVVGTQVSGYNPILQNIRSGVSLQVTPLLGPDSQSCTLDLQSVYSELKEPTAPVTAPSTRPAAGALGDPAAVAVVERVNLISQEFKTSLRIPLGKPILVSGLTLDPAAQTVRNEQLYLVIEATAAN